MQVRVHPCAVRTVDILREAMRSLPVTLRVLPKRGENVRT
jgi:hypothetical protein